jgi:hypothetical protein
VVDCNVVEETWMSRDRGAELDVPSAQKNFVESDPHLGPGDHRPEAVHRFEEGNSIDRRLIRDASFIRIRSMINETSSAHERK